MKKLLGWYSNTDETDKLIEESANFMSNNIYDTANQLEREIRSNESYIQLGFALEGIKTDAEASEAFQALQEVQMKLQQKQQSGEEITEEDVQEAQDVSVKAGENDKVKSLMEAEQGLSALIEELNGIIMKPVQDLYQQ